MNKEMAIPALLTLLALTCSLVSPATPAETTSCTVITRLPATLSLPGTYCLMTDFPNVNLATGAAITITADFVILDLNGHQLRNAMAGATTLATGITAVNQHDLTIRNGTITAFNQAIVISSTLHTETGNVSYSSNNVIDSIRAENSTQNGIVGVISDSIISNNAVADTGTNPAGIAPKGISITGPNNQVVNNDLFSMMSAASVGIYFGHGQSNLAIDNRITQAGTGIVYAAGSGKFRDNLTSGVTKAFDTGSAPAVVNAGNNN